MNRNVFFENRTEPFQALTASPYSFPPHLHPQLELLFVRSGELGIIVREQSALLREGSLAIIFPNQIHSYEGGGEGEVTMINADLSYAGGYLDTLMQMHPASPFLSQKELHPDVVYGVKALFLEYENGENSSSAYGSLLQLILARVMPKLKLHQNRSSDYKNLTWQIASYVNEHYKEHLTLEELAKNVGVSRGRLSHVFSEKMGQSFPVYLANIRLSYARAMLSDTDNSISDISEEAGFESQRTFFRIFRRQHGITPLEYRRKLRGSEEKP